MAVAASPGSAARIGGGGGGGGRRDHLSDLRYLRPVRTGDGFLAPISSSRAAIRGGRICRGRKYEEAGGRSRSALAAKGGSAAASSPGIGRKPLPPDAMTFSSSISTDLPLHESPEASFDGYLDDRPRIFRAMFPDRRRSRQLNEEEWTVQMLPIQFLIASVSPVVVMRLRCSPHRSPEAHPNLSRALDLRVIKWELRGLEGAYSPPHFDLDVRGRLYADRGAGGGRRSRLRGRLQMSISVVLPPVLAVVPEQLLRGVADSVLTTLLTKMKEDVNCNLLRDFQSFRTEKMRESQLLKSSGQP